MRLNLELPVMCVCNGFPLSGGGAVQGLEGESDVVKSGKLSALQLEAIAYACQAHETRLPDGSRAGFFIGDGAGVRFRFLLFFPRQHVRNFK